MQVKNGQLLDKFVLPANKIVLVFDKVLGILA